MTNAIDTVNVVPLETMRELFETRYGRSESPDRFLWLDVDGKYKSAPLQHAWEVWQHAYTAMSEIIIPKAPPPFAWTAFSTRRPPDGTHIIWRDSKEDQQVGTGYYCAEDAQCWDGEWIAVSDLQALPHGQAGVPNE